MSLRDLVHYHQYVEKKKGVLVHGMSVRKIPFYRVHDFSRSWELFVL
jgi:hypothetical protein